MGDNANSSYEREILIQSIVADRMRSSTHWPRLRYMYRQVSREETKCKIYGYPFNIAGQMRFGCFHSAGGVPGFQLMDRGIFCCECRPAC